MSEFLAAIPLSLLLVFSTGPVFFVIVETSITKGAKHAFCVDLGAVLADVVFILAALFSTQSLRSSLAENPRWFIIGGIVLCAFGLGSLIASIRQKKKDVISREDVTKRELFFLCSKRVRVKHYKHRHFFILGWPSSVWRRLLVFRIRLVDLFAV